MNNYINECKELFKILNSTWKGEENAYFKNPKSKYLAQLTTIVFSIMFSFEFAYRIDCSTFIRVIIIFILFIIFQFIFSIILSMILAIFMNRK